MALVILGVLATLWVADRIRSLLFMIFIALFVAVALEPAVQFLVGRGWKRGLATPVVFLGAFLVGVGFVAALVPLFVGQAVELAGKLPSYLTQAQEWIDRQDLVNVDLIDEEIAGQFEDLGSLISRYGSWLAGGIFAVGNTIFGALFQFVTIALFAYYMVADAPKMRRSVLSFLPPARQLELVRIWEIAVEKTGGYIYSRLILAVISAALTAVVLTVIGVPYAIALGLWVGVISQFVPVVGAYIAGVLPVLVALFQRPVAALWVVAWLVAYQQVENFWVAPKITARTMAIHPAVSIGAVIAGASLLGGIGAVLALPVAATVQAFISTALRRHELVEGASHPEEPSVPVEQVEQEGVHPVEGDGGREVLEGVEGVAGAGVERQVG